MKTKILPVLGIIIALILIGYSAVQMEVERDAVREYYDEKEFQEMLGYYAYESGERSYVKVTKTIGIVTAIMVLALMAFNGAMVKSLRPNRFLFIANFVMLGFSAICI